MKNCFVALWLSVLAITSHAAVLAPETKQVNLLHSAQFLEDPSGVLSLDDVRGMTQRFRPWNREGTELNFGLTTSAYWIRVPLQRTETAPNNWLLELHYAKLYQLDFYPPDGSTIQTGSSRAFETRPYYDRFFVFPIDVTTESDYFYLRATSRYSLTVPLTIWQPEAYRQQQQRFQSLQFMYYGGLVVLTLYGLVIYLALRDRRFLIYSAYIVMAGLGVFASNGYGRQMIWPDAISFDEVSQSAFLSMAVFFVIFFARKILLLTSEKSWLTRGMKLSQWLFLLTSLLALLHMLIPVFLRSVNQLLMINSLIMGFLVSVASVRAYLQRRPGIRFFLMGWVVLWLGICIASLRMLGWIPSNGFTSYAVQLSTVIEMVLMALALGDLLRIEHEAYGEAQAQALVSNRALLEMTQASEGNLKRAVEERTKQLEKSLKLEKMLREQYVRFGSMISHEFRTPLGIIQSQTSLMRKEYERGLDQVSKRLGAISSATHRLTVMFDKWLHSDAISQTLEVLEPKPLTLQPWLRQLVHANSHLLLNHSVELHFHEDVDLIEADEYHLGVALTNLIDNAAKYSPENTTIIIETLGNKSHVGISVTDEGPGIPLEIQDKVFAEFFRIAPENNIRGVGLGLSIVHRITLAHGGHMELSSMPGHGATFCIWLPSNHVKDKK
jgi:two-component system, sensor histidine kinase LadS